MEKELNRGNPLAIQSLLQQRRNLHKKAIEEEIERLTRIAPELGVQRMILFGSAARGEPGLASDLDLLVVWDTSLGFLERTVELYRRLKPKVAMDLLVYTPDEMKRMIHRPFIRRALEQGRVLHEA